MASSSAAGGVRRTIEKSPPKRPGSEPVCHGRSSPADPKKAAEKKKEEEKSVTEMFKQLMHGQQATEAKLTAAITAGQRRSEEAARNLEARLTTMMADRDNQMQEKVNAMNGELCRRLDFLENQMKDVTTEQERMKDGRASEASFSTRASGGEARGDDAHHSPLRVVIGGWARLQRKNVIEQRLSDMVESLGIRPNDIFSKKRGQVGFVTCANSYDVSRLIRHIERDKPRTGTQGDDVVMWGKRSQPTAERQRTRTLRTVARTMYSHWESIGRSPPEGFLIDYDNQEMLVDEDIVLRAVGDQFSFVEAAWDLKLSELPRATIEAQAKSFLQNSQ